MTVYPHQPVMVESVCEYLRIGRGSVVVDATVGCGGHAAIIMQAAPGVELLGLDRDRDALETAVSRLAAYGSRVQLRQARFSQLARVMDEESIDQADAILFDLGFSSLQLDRPERGFSFRQDGPLDMRMDQTAPVTASVILNTWSEAELARIFRIYGEEPHSRRIARAVVRRRLERPWIRTADLAALLEQISVRGGRRTGPPPPTRCFQALRIAVNDELQELEQGLAAAIERLRPGGRIVVISFHSLEDRIVKNTFREAARSCVCPPGFPVCVCNRQSRLRNVTKRPVRPDQAEVEANPRAGPARLRAAEKLI